jgi:hypothetical protein
MEKKYTSTEIFGAPGVGKSTFIRKNGWISSQDEYYKVLDNLIKAEFKKKIFFPPPNKIVRMFRAEIRNRLDEEAIKEFGNKHKEFLDLCVFIIFNSPISAERKIECYKFFNNAVLSWWLVKDTEGMVWDESFAKVVLYACGMQPDFSARYFSDIVSVMPKRDKYIFIDGSAEQGVKGQISRGKYNTDMSLIEHEAKMRSAEKYRGIAENLYFELLQNKNTVQKYTSKIDEN